MGQADTNKYRDVGPAAERYFPADRVVHRQEIARYLREFAKGYLVWKTPSRRPLIRRAKRLRRQADRYETCGMEYVVVVCIGCRQVLIGPRRCETRICESCSRKYAGRIRRKQLEIAKACLPKNGRRLTSVVLTKKTEPGFRPQTSDVKYVFNCARKLINKFWPKKWNCGAFAVIEIGKNGNLHVHILAYGFYVPQKTISETWLKITGDSPIVWISQVRGTKKQINYLLKYITKPPKFDNPREMAYFLDMMISVRRIRTYGIFYNWSFAKRDSFPCPLCGGKFTFYQFDDGQRIPQRALFIEELLRLSESESKCVA